MMDHPVLSYADARNMMVDCQVRPNKVIDPRILGAMRRIPRERFIPPSAAPLAYADQNVKLAAGRVLLQPMVIARLVQMLEIREGDRALVVGAGAGYGAALVAASGAQTTALEEDPGLLALARTALAENAPEVSLVSGALVEGWPAGAPWDAILIEGGVEFVPPAIVGQLRSPGGRLTTVLIGHDGLGRAMLGEPSGAAGGSQMLSMQPAFDCATTLLPRFSRAVGFVF
jgi:protein-L-isoaspartate(D-aspartate) O-methyltransferase